MFAAGLATLLFGGLGLLATQQLEKMVGYCVIVSAGTLLTALGMPGVTLTGPALFYLISSVLTTGAFFMLAELIERTCSFGANVLAVTLDAFDLDDPASVNRPTTWWAWRFRRPWPSSAWPSSAAPCW